MMIMARGGLRPPPLLLMCILAAWCAMIFGGALGEVLHSKTFRSPGFVLGPGDVIDRYLPLDMPKGHIAIRSLVVEAVDAQGTSIPLSETYLHHWVLLRYYLDPASTTNILLVPPVPNDGVCSPFLMQMFGLGSETRHTNTDVPAPYGIVVGDPDEVPEGKEEVWYLDVHAIDTRGAISLQGCTECDCALYNVTIDPFGRPLPPGYEGGLFCCHDRSHCPVRKGFQAAQRELFLQFVVTWVDFSDAVIPLKVFILDVTDMRTALDQPPQCMVEYTVPKCAEGSAECVHTKEAVAFLPKGGHVIYIDAHLHNGGLVSSIHRENGEEICVAKPKYGHGNEAGDEEGYVVGMTVCYPEPGSMYIEAGEKLKLRATYDNRERHTGVMGLYYLLVVEGPRSQQGKGFDMKSLLGTLAIVAAVVLGVLAHRRHKKSGVKYGPLVNV